jgi:hypothetical protein
MKTYSNFLTELFDKPLKYRLSHSIEDREEVYEFKTPKGQNIEVGIIVAKNGAYEFMFDSDGDGEATKTNKGEEFRIFATVLKILKEFVDDEAPDHFFIDAVRKEPSRVRLFQSMIRRFLQQYSDYESRESLQGISKRELEIEKENEKAGKTKPEDRKGLIRWDLKVKPQ